MFVVEQEICLVTLTRLGAGVILERSLEWNDIVPVSLSPQATLYEFSRRHLQSLKHVTQ